MVIHIDTLDVLHVASENILVVVVACLHHLVALTVFESSQIEKLFL